MLTTRLVRKAPVITTLPSSLASRSREIRCHRRVEIRPPRASCRRAPALPPTRCPSPKTWFRTRRCRSGRWRRRFPVRRAEGVDVRSGRRRIEGRGVGHVPVGVEHDEGVVRRHDHTAGDGRDRNQVQRRGLGAEVQVEAQTPHRHSGGVELDQEHVVLGDVHVQAHAVAEVERALEEAGHVGVAELVYRDLGGALPVRVTVLSRPLQSHVDSTAAAAAPAETDEAALTIGAAVGTGGKLLTAVRAASISSATPTINAPPQLQRAKLVHRMPSLQSSQHTASAAAGKTLVWWVNGS